MGRFWKDFSQEPVGLAGPLGEGGSEKTPRYLLDLWLESRQG